ncbi:unnamed protein product, partial [Coccothraustes coccothraustes]
MAALPLPLLLLVLLGTPGSAPKTARNCPKTARNCPGTPPGTPSGTPTGNPPGTPQTRPGIPPGAEPQIPQNCPENPQNCLEIPQNCPEILKNCPEILAGTPRNCQENSQNCPEISSEAEPQNPRNCPENPQNCPEIPRNCPKADAGLEPGTPSGGAEPGDAQTCPKNGENCPENGENCPETEPGSDPEDALLVLTVATEVTDGYRRFLRSARAFNYSVTTLGLGRRGRGGDVARSPGGGQKVRWLRAALRPLRHRPRLVLLFVDSYDVVFAGPPRELLASSGPAPGGFCSPPRVSAGPRRGCPLYPPPPRRETPSSTRGVWVTPLPCGLWWSVGHFRDDDDDQLFYTQLYLDPELR